MKSLLLVLSLSSFSFAAEPQVETSFGPIKGFSHKTKEGKEVNVFLGIRYGKAPDHIFRFEKPELVEKWGPMLHHATLFRASCIPHHKQGLVRENYSEDCLFLNVVSPNLKPKKLLPVVVFIHGGGFEIGDSETYGYKTASETLVSQDIIFVSINYRLGVFGFFTTGDRVMPGNYGLWDQTLALRFLHEVLPSFGGDPNQITLMGHSAGSSSVSALMYSPHSDHLFNQAIQLSGSVFAEYSMSDYVIEESKNLAEAVGCKMMKSEQVRDCMKEKTAEELLAGVEKIEGGRRHAHFLKFHPYFDKEFFPFEAEHMARKAPKKKTLQGVTDMESGLFSLMQGVEYLTGGIHIPTERWNNFSRADLQEFMTTGVCPEVEFGRKMGPFLHLLTDFYMDREAPEIPDSKFYIRRYTELISDLQFNVPVYHEIELKRLLGWKDTFYYVIDFVSQATKKETDPLEGALHSSELRFLLDYLGQETIPHDDADRRFQKSFVSSLVAFIKTGNPSTKTLEWKPVTNEAPSRHMRLNADSKMTDEHFRQEAMDFWLKTIPQAIGTDLLKKGRLPAASAHIKHTEL